MTTFGEKMKNKEEITMKKMKFMLFAVAAIATASCAKEISPENNQNGNAPELNLIPMTFTAGAEDADTKVALQSDGKTLHWESTDQIKVFDGTSTDLPAFTTTESGASVDFTGGVAAETGTYYALYPYQADATFGPSAQETAGYGNVIKANVPTVQKAVPNGIDPAAFVAAAKSDNGNGHFNFKSICGFIKFQLSAEDAENAVAVSLSGNDMASITGNVEIFFEKSGTASFGQTYVSNEMNYYVTLEGTFKADTDYYFAVRSNKFAQGFTMTILYADGSSKYVTTTKAPSQSVSRNTVMNLGKPVFKSGLPNDIYIAWMHGLDIDIAGEKFNKSTYGAATLISKSNANDLAGVYFIEAGDDILFQTNYKAVTEPIIIMGRYADKRSNLKQGGIQKLNGDKAVVAYKNLNISWDNVNQPFCAISKTNCIVIDNCRYDYIKNTFITAQTYSVSTVGITNSEIKITGDNKTSLNIYGVDNGNTTRGNDSFTFKNNIVYFVPGTNTSVTFKVFSVAKAGVGSVVIENNIFDSTTIPNDSFAKFASIDGELIIKNNIFNNCVANGAKSGLVGNNTSTSQPTGGEITGNYYYKPTDNTGTMMTRVQGLSTLSKNYSPQLALEPILTDWDPENGKYGIAETITYYNAGSEKNVTVNTSNIGAKR